MVVCTNLREVMSKQEKRSFNLNAKRVSYGGPQRINYLFNALQWRSTDCAQFVRVIIWLVTLIKFSFGTW